MTYKLRDTNNHPIRGNFYDEELQRVDADSFNQDVMRRIDKLRGISQNGGSYYYFVKWLGYPDKFSTWLNAKILQ